MNYALITGASKGIGKAIAFELAAMGKPVILVARSAELLQDLSRELENRFQIKAPNLALDLSEDNAAHQLRDWCLQQGYEVDVLVNNAGYGLIGSFEQYPLEEQLNMMQLNMNTVVRLTYLFLPLLKKHNKSYILNIASSAAYQATPYLALYSATKSFVLLFSRALHMELKGGPVSVTCISPGSTETGFNERAKITEKAQALAQKVQMQPQAVARIAVKAMYQGKTEVITGMLNKLGVFLAWLLPKKTIEKAAIKIYK